MSDASRIFLIVAVAMAALNWFAVARQNDFLEYVSKPAATLAVFATAATLDVSHGAPWVWLLVALVFCLFGDVFLMLPRDAFIPGLASFAVAQVLFTVSFAVGDARVTRFALGLIITLPVAGILARRFVGALRRAGRVDLVAPVVVYMVVISTMATTAIATGNVVAIVGAALFLVSDSLIAESRFVRERRWHGVGIMATYHAALVGLTLSLT